MNKIFHALLRSIRISFRLLRINLILLLLFILSLLIIVFCDSMSIVYKFAEPFFSAFLFYLLISIFQDFSIRREAYNEIMLCKKAIVDNSVSMLKAMSTDAGINYNESYPSDNEMSAICNKITWLGESPTVNLKDQTIHVPWLSYLNEEKRRNLKYLSRIKEYNKVYGDLNLESIANSIIYCKFFENLPLVLEIASSKKLKNGPIDCFSLRDYVENIKKLDWYI